MAYSTALATSLDRVRFLLQDTSATPRVADAEITYWLTVNSNVFYCAALIADALAASLAGVSKKTVGNASVEYDHQYWSGLARSLRRQAVLTGSAPPYAGGISVADVDANDADSDRVRPLFTRTTGCPAEPTRPGWED